MSRIDIGRGDKYTSQSRRPRRDEIIKQDDRSTLSYAMPVHCCATTCVCFLFVTTVLFAALFGWAYSRDSLTCDCN